MSHEIDTTDGVASFASARIPAWHRLGTVLPDLMTAEEAMEAAHLSGWNVRKTPLTTSVLSMDGVTTLDVPDKWATVRTNPINGKPEVLGTVGNGWTAIQNEETADFANAVVDESGAHFETAGAIYGGKQTFLTMKLPEALRLDIPTGGVDVTDLYLVVLNSHDGQSAMRVLITPVRVVCKNTQTLALHRAVSSFSIRHTTGATNAIAEARRTLGLTWRYCAEFEEEMQRLLATPFEREQSVDYFKQVFEVIDTDKLTERQVKGRTEHVDACIDLLGAPTNTMVAGTAYAALNAVTEHIDWTWDVRGKGADQDKGKALRVVMPQFTKLKSRAFELLTAAS